MYCFTCKTEVEIKEIERTFNNGTCHIEARCSVCDRFLKFLPYKKPEEWKFYFGKYDGEKMIDIAKTDREYLEWIVLKSDLPDKIKKKVEQILILIEK